MTRQKDKKEIGTLSEREAAEMGAFTDCALTEEDALKTMKDSDKTEGADE